MFDFSPYLIQIKNVTYSLFSNVVSENYLDNTSLVYENGLFLVNNNLFGNLSNLTGVNELGAVYFYYNETYNSINTISAGSFEVTFSTNNIIYYSFSSALLQRNVNNAGYFYFVM